MREIERGGCKMIHAERDGKNNGVGMTVSGKYVRTWWEWRNGKGGSLLHGRC